ncbi:MAG: hypothetical protein WDW36_008992 [Sanguina aurantia]
MLPLLPLLLKMVNSRMLGTGPSSGAAPSLRIMPPLLDMMNHGQPPPADAAPPSPSDDPAVGFENVRWELALPQPPPASPAPSEPELCVRVVATRDVAPGEPLLLCYSSGHSNDAMFLHYGFVPAGNMDDDVVLFDDASAALNWHCQQYVVRKPGGLAALQQLAVPDLTERYMAALDIARRGEEAAKGPSVEVAAAAGFVKISASGRAPLALLAAFTDLADGDAAHAAAAVARRCVQILQGSTPLLADLATLVAEGRRLGSDSVGCTETGGSGLSSGGSSSNSSSGSGSSSSGSSSIRDSSGVDAEGQLPAHGPGHPQSAKAMVSVNLHIFLRVVHDPDADKLYARGFLFMTDRSTFDLAAHDAQMRSSHAFPAWKGNISLR